LWAYRVTRLAAVPDIGVRKAFRLHKAGTETPYDVALTTQYGVECECPDFGYRRDGQDAAGCKHIHALRAFGMLPEVPRSAARRCPSADRAQNPGAAEGHA
jgi:hypothetical protein